MTPSEGEALFALQLKANKLTGWEREHRFAPPRRWRFDFAHPESWIAVEIEGGHWSGGRHVRGAGFAADCEKYSVAATLGWRVIRATTGQVLSGLAIEWAIAATRS